MSTARTLYNAFYRAQRLRHGNYHCGSGSALPYGKAAKQSYYCRNDQDQTAMWRYYRQINTICITNKIVHRERVRRSLSFLVGLPPVKE